MTNSTNLALLRSSDAFRKPLAVLLFMLCILTYFSQKSHAAVHSTNRDSLWQIWNNEKLEDTVRLNAIKKMIVDVYLKSIPESTFYYANLQYNLAKESDIEQYMAEALVMQGVSFYFLGDYPNALVKYNEAIDIRERLGDKKGVAGLLNKIGLLEAKGNVDRALVYYDRCLTIRKEINDEKGISAVLNNIGNVHRKKKSFDLALDYYQRSLEIKKEVGDKLGVAGVLNNLGLVFSLQGEKEKALKYYLESYSIRELLDDKRGIAGSLINLSSTYSDLKRYKEATECARQAYDLAEKVGSAIEIRDAAYILSKLYEHYGLYDRALKLYKEYASLKDSMVNIQSQRKVLELELRHDFEKNALADSIHFEKEKEYADLLHQTQLQNERVLRYVLYGILVLFMVFFAIYIRLRILRKRKEINELLDEINHLKADAVSKVKLNTAGQLTNQEELDKSKIEAFIGNTLNTSDWSILTCLYENPLRTNKEISEEVSLSVEGVRSSLKKMYRMFSIKSSSRDQRISLIIEAARISNEDN